MIRRFLARHGWAVVLIWTPRHRGLYVYRRCWALAWSWWRTA